MSAAIWGEPPTAEQTADELRDLLRRLGIDVGDRSAWPTLHADRNVYGTWVIALGRVPHTTAKQLVAALRGLLDAAELADRD